MSAPTTRDPLVVNTQDGICWTRRAVTREGRGLYALADVVAGVPDEVLASLADLAEHGLASMADVLPVPVGPGPRTLDVVEEELTGASLSLWEEEQGTARLRLALASAQRGRRDLRSQVAELLAERHSTNEALDDAARALREQRDRIAELEAAPVTVYRAEHPDSGITLGHYGTDAAAREHCETTERHSWPKGTTLAFDWIEDDEDRVAELVVTAGQNEESTTGYIVTALELDSEYDVEADE